MNKMQVFVSFEEVEQEMNALVMRGVADILLAPASNGERPADEVIFDYLDHPLWQERLKTIIGLSGGSIERLKRVFAALMPAESFSAIGNSPKIRRAIARFLSDPQAYRANIPQFIRECFYLRPGWVEALRDRRQIEALVRNNLQSKYAARTGFALEKNIVKAVERLGLGWQKGPVEIVDNKEVDVAIPDTANPRILIMSSYLLTTSSSQSSKANEQTLMYESVGVHNRRRRDNVKFLNVIDGGGWLERKSDLDKMIRDCDRHFTNADLTDGTFAAYLKQTEGES